MPKSHPTAIKNAKRKVTAAFATTFGGHKFKSHPEAIKELVRRLNASRARTFAPDPEPEPQVEADIGPKR